MRRRSLLHAAGAGAVLIAGCATLPRSVELPREQIEAALARRFPRETRIAELLVLRVGAPRLTLLPESNRVRLAFHLDVMERIMRRAAQGELALSFSLRFEPTDATLRAADVRVEAIELQGIPEQWRGVLQSAGALAAEQFLEGAVLHAFTSEQLARAGGLRPGDIRVTPRGVRVELVPPR